MSKIKIKTHGFKFFGKNSIAFTIEHDKLLKNKHNMLFIMKNKKLLFINLV